MRFCARFVSFQRHHTLFVTQFRTKKQTKSDMSWLLKFFTSSLGQKLIMSLTGLFLILFLVIHLIGNVQLLYNDQGEAFNLYTYFMTHNPLIKTVSYGLYLFIIIHTIQGIGLAIRNRAARGNQKYAVQVTRATNTNAFMAKSMAWLGMLILIFLIIHLGDFWYKMKFGELGMVTYEGHEEPVKDLYAQVATSFKVPWIVLAYVIGQIALAMHLRHGFQSAFQTLGINHPKYSPLIRGLGIAYAVLSPLGFAIIPIIFFLTK